MAWMFRFSNSEEGTFLPGSRKVISLRQNLSEWMEGEVWHMPAEEKYNLHIIAIFALGGERVNSQLLRHFRS